MRHTHPRQPKQAKSIPAVGIEGTEYHKINAPFKRHTEGPNKGGFILDEWARPEFEYLAEAEWEWTEKIDGTNIRISLSTHDFEGCRPGPADDLPDSRDFAIGGRTQKAQLPWDLLAAIEALDLEPKLREDFDGPVTLYGEGYGPGIQKGGGYRKDKGFILFDIKVGHWWLERASVEALAAKWGLDVVPVVGTGTLNEAMAYVSAEFRHLTDEEGRYEAKTMRSVFGDFEAEGLMCRPKVQMFDRRGARIICKVKVKDFRQAPTPRE